MTSSQLNEVRVKMQASLDFLQQELNQIRTGRASASLVENVMVMTYGGAEHLRIRELGNITTPDPKTVMVEFWDSAVVADAERAINQSLNLTCQMNDNILRIFIPSLTEERRREFVKKLKLEIEKGKVAIRQVRADYFHSIKRAFEAKDIPEDERFRDEKEVQKLTDEFIEKIDAMEKKKEEEIMTV